MLTISVPTAMLLMMIVSLSLAAMTLLVWGLLERHRAVLVWAIAHALWAGSILLLMGRGILPDVLSILVANAMAVSSLIAVWWGVALFIGKPLPMLGTASISTAYGLAFPWLTWITPSLSARVVVVRLLMLFALTGALHTLLVNRKRIGNTKAILLSLIGLLPGMLVMGGTLIGAVLTWESPAAFFEHPMVRMTVIGGIVANLTWGLSVLFLVIERRSLLREQDEAVHHVLTEQSVVGLYMIEGDRFTYVNNACADIFGYCPQVLVDEMQVSDLAIPEDRERLSEGLRRYASGELNGRRYHYRAQRRNGELVDIEGEARLAHWQGRNVVVGVMVALGGTVPPVPQPENLPLARTLP